MQNTKRLVRRLLGAVSPEWLRAIDRARQRAYYLREPSRGPQRLLLEPTTACNYRCEMCLRHSPRVTPRPTAKHMPFEQLERLITDAADMGVEWVWLAGQGEPLVHPQAEELLHLMGARGLQSMITTNGQRLTWELAEKLFDYGLRKLSVSINAGRAETYGQIHHVAPEERARVVALVGRLAQRQERPALTASLVVTKMNAGEILEFTQDVLAAGVGEVVIGGMRPVPFDPAGLALEAEDWKRVRADIARAAELVRQAGAELLVDAIPAEETPQATGWPYAQMGCFIAHRFAAISVEGAVHGCCSCQNRLGSLATDSFLDIWHSSAYRTFRGILRELPVTGLTPPQCDCRHGCGHVPENVALQQELGFHFSPREVESPFATRAEAARMLARAFAEQLPTGEIGPGFADLPPADAELQQAATRLRQAGVFRGTGAQGELPLFDPRQLLSHRDLAEVLRRTLRAAGVEAETAQAQVAAVAGERAEDTQPVRRSTAQEWVTRAAAQAP